MQTEYFKYIPNFIDPKYFELVYDEIKKYCQQRESILYGKRVLSPRKTCFFAENSNVDYGYSNYDRHVVLNFSKACSIKKIKKLVEKELGQKFNGCLAHIYRDGNDYISWHNDKEALEKPVNHVASISLGAARKFRLRRIGETSGWDHEFVLSSGDLFYMYGDCQKKYKHTVPKEKRVKDARINLTFRIFE